MPNPDLLLTTPIELSRSMLMINKSNRHDLDIIHPCHIFSSVYYIINIIGRGQCSVRNVAVNFPFPACAFRSLSLLTWACVCFVASFTFYWECGGGPPTKLIRRYGENTATVIQELGRRAV